MTVPQFAEDIIADRFNLVTLDRSIAFVTMLVTAAVPIVIYFWGKRANTNTHELVEVQNKILRAQRLGELVHQMSLAKEGDDFDAIFTEAKSLGPKQDLLRIEREYWLNPYVSLSSAKDSASIKLSSQKIGLKLSGKSIHDSVSELEHFLANAKLVNTEVAAEVVDWIMSTYKGPNGLSDCAITALVKSGADDLSAWMLGQLDQIHNPPLSEALVNILAGVSIAFLSRIKFYERDAEDNSVLTAERADSNIQLSASLGQALASLFHRNRLVKLAEKSNASKTIDSGAAAALVVAVAGAVSYCDLHFAMRCAQNLETLGIRRTNLGKFERHLNFGQEKFASYQPLLSTEYKIDELGG